MNARFRSSAVRGMVLLEVILALTIFSLVTLGLVMALDQCFGAANVRNQADAVTRGLRNQLALLHGGSLVPGTHALVNAGNGVGASYTLQVDPVPMSDQRQQPLLGLYRATIVAQWKEGAEQETRSVSELIYQP